MPRRRVVEFLTCLEVGGTERHVAALARTLDPARFDVRVACLRAGGPLSEEVEAAGVPIDRYPISRLFGPATWRMQRRFAADLRRNRIDIVHAYGLYAIVFAVPVARLAGTRLVIASIRDNGDPWTRAHRRVQRWVCRLAHGILTNAAEVRRRLQEDGYNERSIAVIRNGVDVRRFQPRPRDPVLRRSLGVPADARLVVCVSRLNPLKGVDYALLAASRLVRKFPNVHMLIIGDGAERRALEDLAHRLGLDGRVGFTRMRLDVPEILAQASVSIMPSMSEALPNTVLESMASGAPIVATRVGGTSELVEDGVTGLLIPPCDPHALEQAIARLLTDPDLAARLAATARARIVERFSLERKARETAAFYEAHLHGRRPQTIDPEEESGTAAPASVPAGPLERRRRQLWELERRQSAR
jgi:glycosyltransferase involved in cell wall biosynthesis